MVYILPVEILLTQIENNSYLKRTLLNPHRGYVKIDAYLLQLLCNMTSDVKFLHVFFLFTLLFKSFILRSKTTLTVLILIFLEAVVQRCSSNQVFLKTCNFIKKRLRHRCFPVNLQNTLFHRTSLVAAFVFSKKSRNEKMYSLKYIHRKTLVKVSFLCGFLVPRGQLLLLS